MFVPKKIFDDFYTHIENINTKLPQAIPEDMIANINTIQFEVQINQRGPSMSDFAIIIKAVRKHLKLMRNIDEHGQEQPEDHNNNLTTEQRLLIINMEMQLLDINADFLDSVETFFIDLRTTNTDATNNATDEVTNFEYIIPFVELQNLQPGVLDESTIPFNPIVGNATDEVANFENIPPQPVVMGETTITFHQFVGF